MSARPLPRPVDALLDVIAAATGALTETARAGDPRGMAAAVSRRAAAVEDLRRWLDDPAHAGAARGPALEAALLEIDRDAAAARAALAEAAGRARGALAALGRSGRAVRGYGSVDIHPEALNRAA
jgi:hypothetical protein